MSSPLLSDSPSTFKVDCNVVGALLENRPKFKFFAKFFRLFLLSFIFFYQHGNLLNQRTTQVGLYIIPLYLGQRLEMSFQKGARSQNKMEDKIQLQASRGLWFDTILIMRM